MPLYIDKTSCSVSYESSQKWFKTYLASKGIVDVLHNITFILIVPKSLHIGANDQFILDITVLKFSYMRLLRV